MDNGTAHGVPIGEAADRLGLTTAAVRKRIRRGSLKATKQDDGTWLIYLPETLGEDVSRDTGGPASTLDGMAYAELIEQLKRENAHLWEELRSRGEELRRKDIIIAELAQQLKALPAAIVERQAEHTKQAPEPPTPAPARPWWKFWVTS